MQKAFDVILQTEVTADVAAANSDNEAFRYECLCCGEEVFLAAQNSMLQATHFRHRSGNNDKECELYLGGNSVGPFSVANRKSKQERVEFYYENTHKAFYMSFHFSEDEISTYEGSNTFIEVRESKTDRPFFTKRIDHINFCEDIPEMYMLERYASPYYISNTANNIKREYGLFSDNRPTVFKIQGDDAEYKAKYIKSNSLYTNIRYLIAWPGCNTAQIKLQGMPGVNIDSVFQFRTMHTYNVWALTVTFTEKNSQLDQLLLSWGFNLSVSEELVLLWPPAYESNETLLVSSEDSYIFSSFSLQAHGNINISDNDIHKISEKVTRVKTREKVKILKKNAEMTILLIPNDKEDAVLYNTKHSCTKRFVVPDSGTYYLFSQHGVEKLFAGQKVYLTATSFVAEYQANYLSQIISIEKDKEATLDERIKDALAHYWVSVEFNETSGNSSSEYVLNYLGNCKKKGYINRAVLQMIEEET